MEESQKRRERLKAIRSEAAESKDLSSSQIILSNPLVNAKSTTMPLPTQENSCGSPRFDFYTDPLTSFSGDRKRNKNDSRTPHCSFASPLRCTTGVSRKWKSPQDPYHTPSTHNSPRQLVNAPLQTQEISGYGFRGSNTSVGFRQGGSPCPSSGSGGPLFQSTPSPVYGSDICSPSPNSGQMLCSRNDQNRSPSSWRSQSFDLKNAQSSSPNLGRGSSGWYSGNSLSPGSGRGYGRKGARSRFFSVKQNPEKFFNTSMVEDPWKSLAPVVWKVGFQSKSESWLPQSISVEKAKASETRPVFNSQANLAEFLAESFNEVSRED